MTAADITDELVTGLLAAAIRDEDFDMVELCEDTQRMIIRVETVTKARAEIARILNARAMKESK